MKSQVNVLGGLEGARDMRYDELFTRNYGIFSREEQKRVKSARVTIIGCGGIGARALIKYH